ncbi:MULTISPECIES: hypothetical protein [Deferrisoma]
MDSGARRLSALFVLGVILFFSPLLALFNRPVAVAGVPLLPLYLFLAWAVLLALAPLLLRTRR